MKRIWPAADRRLVCFALIVAGPIGVVVGIKFGVLALSAICAFLPLLGARLIGWVEVEDGELRHRRLIGESTTIAFADVREVGLGMHHGRRTKWWYPEVETNNGESIKFLMLRSKSGKDTIARTQQIFESGMASMPDEPVIEQFTSVTAAGELELMLTPGYDSFLRQRAEAEATAEPLAPALSMPAFGEPEPLPVQAVPTPVEPPARVLTPPPIPVPPPVPAHATTPVAQTPSVPTPLPVTATVAPAQAPAAAPAVPERHLRVVEPSAAPTASPVQSGVPATPPVDEAEPTLMRPKRWVVTGLAPPASPSAPAATNAQPAAKTPPDDSGASFTSLFSRAA